MLWLSQPAVFVFGGIGVTLSITMIIRRDWRRLLWLSTIGGLAAATHAALRCVVTPGGLELLPGPDLERSLRSASALGELGMVLERLEWCDGQPGWITGRAGHGCDFPCRSVLLHTAQMGIRPCPASSHPACPGRFFHEALSIPGTLTDIRDSIFLLLASEGVDGLRRLAEGMSRPVSGHFRCRGGVPTPFWLARPISVCRRPPCAETSSRSWVT